MKLPLAILIGCAFIAGAIHFGLTHDKRTYLADCEERNSIPGVSCEQQWLQLGRH